MPTFPVLLEADADSSSAPRLPVYKNSTSSHICLFIIYLSTGIQEVAGQASRKSSCLSKQDDVFLWLDFQLLLVNQDSILKIKTWVTARPLKANCNRMICYSIVLWPLVDEAKCLCGWISSGIWQAHTAPLGLQKWTVLCSYCFSFGWFWLVVSPSDLTQIFVLYYLFFLNSTLVLTTLCYWMWFRLELCASVSACKQERNW